MTQQHQGDVFELKKKKKTLAECRRNKPKRMHSFQCACTLALVGQPMCLCVSVIKTPLWSLSSPHWQLHSHTALMNGWRERAKKQREKESTRCERKIEATEGCVKRKTYELTSIQDKNNPGG